MTTADQIAMGALVEMARDINKDLPPDIWNYIVHISMSEDGVTVTATAIPRSDMYATDDEE